MWRYLCKKKQKNRLIKMIKILYNSMNPVVRYFITIQSKHVAFFCPITFLPSLTLGLVTFLLFMCVTCAARWMTSQARPNLARISRLCLDYQQNHGGTVPYSLCSRSSYLCKYVAGVKLSAAILKRDSLLLMHKSGRVIYTTNVLLTWIRASSA